MKKRLFENQRFITRGVAEQIPPELQLLMWSMIEDMPEQDYLQVFDISISNSGGEIHHTQEVPKYEKEVTVVAKTVSDLNVRVFVIDDETHSTMLLAEEY